MRKKTIIRKKQSVSRRDDPNESSERNHISKNMKEKKMKRDKLRSEKGGQEEKTTARKRWGGTVKGG